MCDVVVVWSFIYSFAYMAVLCAFPAEFKDLAISCLVLGIADVLGGSLISEPGIVLNAVLRAAVVLGLLFMGITPFFGVLATALLFSYTVYRRYYV